MVRLTAIELRNFKSVSRGRLTLSTGSGEDAFAHADIVGIYGQNGSGKTSVVNAFSILKTLWLCRELPESTLDCIAVGAPALEIEIEGIVDDDVRECFVSFKYLVAITECQKKPLVIHEKIDVKDLLKDGRSSMRTLFDYEIVDADSNQYVLKPKKDWGVLLKKGGNMQTEAIVAQRFARDKSTSFFFQSDFLRLLRSFCEPLDALREGKAPERMSRGLQESLVSIEPLVALAPYLFLFAIMDLAVISPSRQAEPTLNLLRIATHEGEYGEFSDTSIDIDLNVAQAVDSQKLEECKDTIDVINSVLGSLVPGLSLGVEELGPQLLDDGTLGERIELTASRNGVKVPLRCESEGIKKLVTILALLIDVYAKPGACVVIDELDSGVFEYLLGEILEMLQKHGKGQLIFTAHNLRPLETLGVNSLFFTTTNPDRRYIKFVGKKATNNLRNLYLRAIDLGGQPEVIYEPTSRYEMEDAFYLASRSILRENDSAKATDDAEG